MRIIWIEGAIQFTPCSYSNSTTDFEGIPYSSAHAKSQPNCYPVGDSLVDCSSDSQFSKQEGERERVHRNDFTGMSTEM